MLELILCSSLTVLPDYLFRRYAQGKRFGHEITFYSVWFELRWGIVACLLLTVTLITIIFYNHPTTNSVTSFYRTVPILPETAGRVAEVFVGMSDEVAAGDPILRLDSASQAAALETARLRAAEVDASVVVAQTDLAAAEGRIVEAQGALDQALDELEVKVELRSRDPGIVPAREIERLETLVEGRQGGVTAAVAGRQAVETQISTLLPAQKASAEAALAEAQVDLDQRILYAGVSGRVEQFTVRVGEFLNPMLRPAGILVPTEAGRNVLVAGFGQIEAHVMKVGMTAEVTCISQPFTVIPMVVTQVQDYIAAGQVRLSDTLVDAQQVTQPGTLTVFMEPMWEGGIDGIPPGSSCIANAYTSNHDLLASGEVTGARAVYLHMVDAVGLVHAMILRIQALLLPVRTLVFSGGH